MANVVMLPKSHPPTSIEKDLRTISSTPTLSKILEALIGGWMLVEISSKFNDHQYGAAKGRSTTHKLVNILHVCHQAADNQKITRAAFVDFAKAFDHVDHHIVLNKMAALGVHHSMDALNFTRASQRVKINIIVSNWATWNGGMPQGTWLGPYIFLIHINDLRDNASCLHSKFFDDVTVIEVIEVSDSIASSRMQTQSTRLSNGLPIITWTWIHRRMKKWSLISPDHLSQS